jgi:hypothetical protein
MDVHESTTRYENWMRDRIPVVEKQLRDKHALMRQSPFLFFRGTYYRWAQLWPEVCPECADAPTVLSVSDLHVDNFGTWRDAEGRLCWGVNDFDEAWPLPFTNDLIRLAASVKIARRLGLLALKTREACEMLLDGYQGTLENGACPIVLAEQETHLEKLGIAALKPPERFWETLNRHPAINGRLPGDVKKALEEALPNPHLKYRVVQRESGIGSLGHHRFVAIGECDGGYIAREAKRLIPAANAWLDGRTDRAQTYYEKILSCSIRSRDPYLTASKAWLIRRLSPDSNPIHVEELAGKRDERTLLRAMGTETANVHLGVCGNPKAIIRDLRRRRSRRWLADATKKMAKVVVREWKEYKG